MGVVANQSFKNIILTYLGFLIGGINTLFLYTQFLSTQQYGMVNYMLSLATVLTPLMAFGVHNTLIKFYSSFKTRSTQNSFLTLMLFLPLVIVVPVVAITYLFNETISDFLAVKNEIIKDYIWHTCAIAIALGYFEIFFAWIKVQMKTVFGTFMKEVFHRAGAMLLLILLYFKVVNLDQFMIGLVCVYVSKMLVMKIYAFSVKFPKITFKKLNNLIPILKYSVLIIIAGSVATVLLDIDKVMMGSYIKIKNIAYYSVAVYIAAVIAVPQRAMHQILMPLSAKYLNEKNYTSLKNLYQKSSLNLFIVSGFVFLLIVLNINELYEIMPNSNQYHTGLFVLIIVSISKLYDALLGSNNAILFNSDYYRVVLTFGVILVTIMILLNMLFIPKFGINGAAIATFIAVFLYNTAKIIFVYKKFKILPFSKFTLKIMLLISAFVLAFYFWEFPFNPIINIACKTFIVFILYVLIIYKLNFSKDITTVLKRYLKLK
ncbi:lipopolysaccharide biosynthesis protein [Neotamlana laminarinivorans]|uniref:Polysaccharide biosynthesis C-terminal domain-containing protein n=1 Tax=Neotamlana laminarinivorans TaxID=2883124 RepID=A0A9X1HZY9_9FLAO|nr:polysaccharide biosynthesis C-terminal domain-containing protein [Tamlana laminarinivorans]MCB4797627.1 polysaccharide biosynthesis C-terminal domain-containing protein [Tamlana laminarinivorans]